MSSKTHELHRLRAHALMWVFVLAGSLAGCRQATAPGEPAGPEAAPAAFSGSSLGPKATSSRTVLDRAKLRSCLELGAEREWRSSELERLDPLFDAASARSKVLQRSLATPPAAMDANELLRRIQWARELDRLTQEREEMGRTLPDHLSRFVELNNAFVVQCRDADYREADLRTLGVDYFGKDDGSDAKQRGP